MADPITLDGRTLEGGGQLLRNALCLSALTGQALRIHNIRGNRGGGGGLKAQHLACVNWLATACNAKVEGAEKGSKELLFVPGAGGSGDGDECPGFRKKTVEGGRQVWETRVEIGSAGSTGLALQAVLPFILFSKRPVELPVRLVLSGGTNVTQSPSYEYITQVLLPMLKAIGLPEIKAELGKRGWSHGGSSIGNITLEIPARKELVLPAFRMAPADIKVSNRPAKPSKIQATFIAPSSCHEIFSNTFASAVSRHFGTDTDIELESIVEDSNHQKRLYLLTVAIIPATASSPEYRLGTDWLYDGKIRSFDLATYAKITKDMIESCLRRLKEEWLTGGYVDEHLRDQLVIFQALAEGQSVVWAGREVDGGEDVDEGGSDGDGGVQRRLREPSLHARTAEWVAKKMLKGVRFDEEGRCRGAGLGANRAEREAKEVLVVETMERLEVR